MKIKSMNKNKTIENKENSSFKYKLQCIFLLLSNRLLFGESPMIRKMQKSTVERTLK